MHRARELAVEPGELDVGNVVALGAELGDERRHLAGGGDAAIAIDLFPDDRPDIADDTVREAICCSTNTPMSSMSRRTPGSSPRSRRRAGRQHRRSRVRDHDDARKPAISPLSRMSCCAPVVVTSMSTATRASPTASRLTAVPPHASASATALSQVRLATKMSEVPAAASDLTVPSAISPHRVRARCDRRGRRVAQWRGRRQPG